MTDPLLPLPLDGLRDLQRQVSMTAESKGWHDPYVHDNEEAARDSSAAERIALIQLAAARMLEALRESGDVHKTWEREPDGKPQGVVYEAAEVVHRVLDFCAVHNLDLGGALGDLMKYNEGRPRRTGGKHL